MSRKNGKDYLFLIWKQPESRRQYVVGILSKMVDSNLPMPKI